jgi:Flp pilus assembly pilin Flp
MVYYLRCKLFLSDRSHELMRGQGLAEYGLILVLVAIAVVLIVTLLGEDLTNIYENIVTSVRDAG